MKLHPRDRRYSRRYKEEELGCKFFGISSPFPLFVYIQYSAYNPSYWCVMLPAEIMAIGVYFPIAFPFLGLDPLFPRSVLCGKHQDSQQAESPSAFA